MNLVHGLLSAFGGSANLTAVLAILGGYTGIAMIAMSPLMAIVLKANWSTQKKNISVWVACFGVSGLGMYLAHAFTGSLWDIGTWTAAWGALGVGATTLHDKIWGSDGTGISTWIEHNFFPGTDVPVPTTVDEVANSALKILKELGLGLLKNGVVKAGQKLTEPKIYTGAGTAGAVPAPDTAPLVGGATIDTSVPVDPTRLAAQAILDAIDAHATTGQNVVIDPSTLPVVPLTAPPITPAPSVQAKIDAVSAAIKNGQPVEEVAAPGGSE
jgi:hypothetical protein